MSKGQRVDFWLIDLPAYGLAALAAFVIGTALAHWSVGLVFAVAVVQGMRSLGPAFKRLLGGKESP